MANLKTYNRTKKLAQNGSMLDAFVAEQMYNKIDAIVEEAHLDKEQILVKTGKDLARQLVSLTDTLAQRVEQDVKAVQSDTESSIAEHRAETLQKIEDTLLSYTDKTERAVQEVKDKAAMVLVAIESKRGPKGEPGNPGKDGKDGAPDTGEEIAKKLNKTKGTVSMGVIAGLLEEIQALKREVRKKGEKGGGGGGGMGNVVTQSTAINSVTTNINLESNVASKGKAIWFNYQGQQQAYGTHFTVSGKIITLLFTPDDNTYADIIYIRA